VLFTVVQLDTVGLWSALMSAASRCPGLGGTSYRLYRLCRRRRAWCGAHPVEQVAPEQRAGGPQQPPDPAPFGTAEKPGAARDAVSQRGTADGAWGQEHPVVSGEPGRALPLPADVTK